MRKILVTIAVLFLFPIVANAQDFGEIWNDAKEIIRTAEDVLNTGDGLKKKYIGETAEVDVTNAFPEYSDVLLEINFNSNRTGDTVLRLFPGESKVYKTRVFSDEGTNANMNVKAFRDGKFLFSYQREIYLSMGYRSTSHTVNENMYRNFAGTGKTFITFVNQRDSVSSITYWNNGQEHFQTIKSRKSFTVEFNSDESPSTTVLVEKWVRNESGKMVVCNSEQIPIIFRDLFQVVVIK